MEEVFQGHFNFHELSKKRYYLLRMSTYTPATLGKDRLGIGCWSKFIYPGKNVLAINAGTCITYDFVDVKALIKAGQFPRGSKCVLRPCILLRAGSVN